MPFNFMCLAGQQILLPMKTHPDALLLLLLQAPKLVVWH
jgi:hypothetical protein